jgi:uncharacterized protein (TIGR03086 family)
MPAACAAGLAGRGLPSERLRGPDRGLIREPLRPFITPRPLDLTLGFSATRRATRPGGIEAAEVSNGRVSDPSGVAPIVGLRVALDAAGRVVAAVRTDQWSLPTPCSEWTIADLTAHVVGGNRLFAALLRAGVAPPPRDVEPAQLPDAYAETVPDLIDAFTAQGVLERPVTVPFGTVPGAVALHLRITELLVHGWDLAIATGQSLDVPEDLAREELAFSTDALQRLPADRSPFGAPQQAPADATALEQLAALLGRSVPR